MPSKKAIVADTTDQPTGLTDGELRFVKAIFDNMMQKPDANWENVAGDLGLKDAKCAKERFRQMSIRHSWGTNGSSAVPSPRRSRAAANCPVGEAKIKKSRTPRKTRAVKQEELGSDEVKTEDCHEVDKDGAYEKF
ncbi:hypothetical protein RJ55_00136 [Drechmeria coniospora]|nr:hypothetical protein RJ55_00136 [Drechmeria coniospora]